MGTLKRIASNRHVRRSAAAGAVLLLLFAVAGFLILPPVLKPYVKEKISETLHHDVSIAKFRVNPFALSFEVEGLHIKDRTKEGTLFSAERIYVNVESISLFKEGLVVSELKVHKPYVNIEVTGVREGNFSDLLVRDLPKLREELRPYKFSVNNISVTGGSIDYFDGPKGMGHLIRDMTLTIPFISNLPYHAETAVSPYFRATVNGDPVVFRGTTKLFSDSLETRLDVKVSGFDVPFYLAYIPFEMDIELVSCVLDTDLKVAYAQYRDRAPSLALAGDVKLSDLRLREKQGRPLLDVKEVSLSIASSDLMERRAHLSTVAVRSPEVVVARDRDGKTNLEKLGLVNPQGTDAKASDRGRQKAFMLTIDELTVEEGKAMVSDSTEHGDFRTRLGALQVKVAHLSTEPGTSAAVALSFSTDSDEAMKLEGTFSLDPPAAEGVAEVRRLALGNYAAYSGRYTPAAVSGRVDVSSRFNVTRAGEALAVSLTDLGLDVSSLVVKTHGEGEEVLKIPVLGLRGGAFDYGRRELVIQEISSRGGGAFLKRLKDGSFNLQGLLKDGGLPQGPGEAPAAEQRPWSVTVRRVDLDQYSLKAVDTAPSEPAQFVLDRMGFTAEGLSTVAGARGTVSLSCRINRRGGFNGSGSFSLSPVAVEMTAALKDFDLTDLQPYLDERIKLIVVEGRLSSKGRLSAGYAAETGPRVTYGGEVLVADFASIDAVNADDFLKWKSLFLGGVDVRYGPAQLTVREVALADFYSRLVINPDGSLNVRDVLKAGQPEEGDQPPPSVAGARAAELLKELRQRVEIGRVTVQGGTVDFKDYFIKPNYAVRLLEIGGRISGLSSREDAFAEVELRGKVDNYAPVEITGRMNPFREDLLVELTGNFRNIELSPVTPYAGKYLGYTIEKGKLTMQVEYRVAESRLDAKNSVFLDQFTLGDRVESPTATKLPVKLAIALLKNRRGEISLDVPVSGSLKDPEFSLGAVVLKVLVNILVKAATSPFALLGAIFGGGEQLSYAEFDYGSSIIPAEASRKLDTLVKALEERPGLTIDITGHVDRENDAEGLRQRSFERKVKAQKLKEKARREQATLSVDDVQVGAEEYPKYLKLAYKEEKFPKPRTFLGVAKDLPDSEMEKLILTNIEVRDEDLKTLADRRSQAVRDYILQGNRVDAARVFILEPKTLEAESKEGLRNSRADFTLR